MSIRTLRPDGDQTGSRLRPPGVPVILTIGGGDWFPVTPAPVTLAPGGQAERHMALFPAVACLTGRLATVDGRVLAGTAVQIFQDGRGLVTTADTDGDGWFRAAALPTLAVVCVTTCC